MALEIVQIPVLNDNYVYLLKSGSDCAVVDPAVAEPVVEALTERGWTLSHILNTHHHGDHTGANLELKAKYGCTIIGAANDAARIPGIDVKVAEGDTVSLGDSTAEVLEVPGHTSGHIAYHFASDAALFCGDTLFALGCGRLFEGSAAQMWQSLSKIKALPLNTRCYCAHEYTQSNAAFAVTVDPENLALQARMGVIQAARAADRPTVPSLLADELATNPFLRPDDAGIREALDMADADDTAVFAEIRLRKDTF